MALGALTIERLAAAEGPLRADLVKLVGPASYTTNGDTGLQTALRTLLGGNYTIQGVINTHTAGYQVAYDHANDKVLVYRADNDAGADSPLVQVPSTTDLSAVNFYLTILSQ